ncbi:MAG: M28 family peptidase [Colwellia sp.]|nr:M28 family peptidase [Colwellia sp.]
MSLLSASLITACFTFAGSKKISLAQVTKDITYLASDDLKGRGNFSAEISQAANYIAKRFKENGLVAADAISAQGFLQKYQVTKIRPKELSLTLNGQVINSENLAMASTVANFSWLITENAQANNTDNKFKVHSVSKDDDMQAFINKLNKQGGQHLVLLNPAHETLFKPYQNYFKRGVTKLKQDNTDKVKGGVIVIVLTATTAKQIKSLQVSGVSTISNNELTNVVAVLPGKSKPDEIVLYSAHYDHLGMKNAEGDNIYNGADDNASGTTAIINIAQYYAKQGHNARTLLFAAFSAEELGGFGSQYFSKQLDPKTITAMINIEMIGKPSKFGAGSLWMTGMERSTLGEQLNNVLAKDGKKIHQDPYPEQGLFYRSDNATLARLGVPAHSFISTQLDKDKHYHQVSDDINSLNLSSLHKVIEALAIATQPLVDGSITPSRIDVNLVKKKGLIY